MTLETAKETLTTSGAAAAIAHVESGSDARAAMAAYRDLLMYAYWERKDLAAAIAIATAGSAYSLSVAENLDATAPKGAKSARLSAQILLYNLASFCWPGWDEPGIPITPADAQVGTQAAELSLALVERLRQDDVSLARGLWMVAAHDLAAKRYAEAEAHFIRSAGHAGNANARAEQLLSEGFAQLTRVLAGTIAADADRSLQSIKQELRPLKDGEAYLGQIETAERLWRHA